MPGIVSTSTKETTQGIRQSYLTAAKRWQTVALLILLIGLSNCQNPTAPKIRHLNIQQSWELNPGDKIRDYLVTGSLGDISLELRGDRLYAPFTGRIEPAMEAHCIIYSTAEVPAYLFRFCGLQRPLFGPIQAGQTMGTGAYLQFATLRRQPDGTWIIVEPSTEILERALNPNTDLVPATATSNSATTDVGR